MSVPTTLNADSDPYAPKDPELNKYKPAQERAAERNKANAKSTFLQTIGQYLGTSFQGIPTRPVAPAPLTMQPKPQALNENNPVFEKFINEPKNKVNQNNPIKQTN